MNKYINTLRGLRLIRNKIDVIKHILNISKEKIIRYELKDGVSLFVPNLKRNRTTILSVNEIFGDEIYPLKSNEKKIVLDIGAQAGIFSIYVAKKNKNTIVYAVEPDPNNFSQLCENIKNNNLSNQIVPIKKPFPIQIKISNFTLAKIVQELIIFLIKKAKKLLLNQ